MTISTRRNPLGAWQGGFVQGQACRCGGEGTTIARVLAVVMTRVTWVVVEIVTLELVAVMHHSVEV